MSLRRRAPAASTTTEEAKPVVKEVDFEKIFSIAVDSSNNIPTAKIEDCLGSFLNKSVTELASMQGNASTILLSQFSIYFKRNYGETASSIINKDCPDFKVAIDRAEIIASRRKTKKEIF